MHENVASLLHRLGAAGVSLVAEDGRLVASGPGVVLDDETIARLRDSKGELLELIARHPRATVEVQAEARGYALAALESIADPADWPALERDPRLVEELLDALDRSAGKVPPSYTAIVECQKCGPVWVRPQHPARTRVSSCCWCFNRLSGLPVTQAKSGVSH